MRQRIDSIGTIRRTSQTLVVLMLFIAVGSAVLAQLPTATILGVVKDSSGAVIPNATITAHHLDTGQTRIAIAARDGSYRLSAMPVGNYEVRAENPGFQSQVQRGLTLTVGQEAVVNLELTVGTVEQTIEVTAEAPLVNTTSGSLGGLVDEQRIGDLPLNGRNYIDLTLLQTGITVNQNHSTAVDFYGIWFSSNGAPVRSNNYLLDGAIMQDIHGAGSASVSNSTLGVEGIREYRVVTNSFSAEYGMTMGSQMMIVSKGGTNSLHGSLFEYLRNSALDARNFFDRKTASNPRRLQAFTRNNFGVSLGGPVKKDKTFFFGVYEGLRERLGRTIVTNTIPASAKVDGGLGGVQQIAPVIKPLLTLFPDPNLPGDQFTFPFSQPTREDYGQMRMDQTFSTNDTLFVRYTIDDTEQLRSLSYPRFIEPLKSRSQFSTLSETHVFSPTLLSTFRFSYSRSLHAQTSPSGIIGPGFSMVPGEEIGGINISNITPLGPALTLVGTQEIFTLSADLFYARGRHSLKFGTLTNRYRQYLLNDNLRKGSVDFANLATFLLAQPTIYRAVTPGSKFDRTYRYNTLGFYVQDDIRASRTLTLNLGLRYEFSTETQEVHGISAALRDPQRDAKFTLGPLFKNPSLRNISPRFGFAWDVMGNGQTALRGGFGLLYDIGNLGSSLVGAIFGSPLFTPLTQIPNPPTLTLPFFLPPQAAGKSLSGVDYNLQPPHMLQYNLTLERQLPFHMGLTLAYGGSRGLNLMQVKELNPTIPQVRDGRQFWTGNDPRTNPYWNDHRSRTAGSSSWYNSLQVGVNKRLSEGLQFQSSYTWAKLIDFTQNQTPADITAGGFIGADPSHREVDKGVADFDITHNWRFNAIYRLPELSSAGGALGKVLNGWWVSGILSLQTGYAFTPSLGTNRSRSKVDGGGGGKDRPDLVPGRSNDNIILGGPDRYFDPSAFTIPAAGFLGNAGRNILRAPGFANLDFSVVKDTKLESLGESGELEFRAEFFNVLNRANFGTPARTVFSAVKDVEAPLSSVGQITSIVGTSRQIQLALKILF